MCSNAFDLFSVVARPRNNVQQDELEAVYIKLYSPVYCQQEEHGTVLYLV